MKLIRQNCRHSNTRVYTIGIGDFVSDTIVVRGAEAGNGKYELIRDMN